MKIGIQTSGLFEKLGIEKSFEAIKDAGFDCVDLNLDGEIGLSWEEIRQGKPSVFFCNESNYKTYTQEVVAASRKTGVSVGQVHAPFPIHLRGCEEANRRGLESPSTKEEEWETNIAFYRELIPLLKQYGVICCLENMWAQDWRTKKIYMGICSDMSETNRYIDALNEIAGETCFGFCLDIGHLTLLGLDSYAAIKTLGKRLVTLHIHDNGGTTDDHVIPFTGVTIWDRFLRGLAEIGYEGTLSFETAESQRKVPVELIPAMLSYTVQIGKYFDRTITEIKSKK